jgi:hypothetical protein
LRTWRGIHGIRLRPFERQPTGLDVPKVDIRL